MSPKIEALILFALLVAICVLAVVCVQQAPVEGVPTLAPGAWPAGYAQILEQPGAPGEITMRAKYLGNFRVTWYGKGRYKDGSKFTGKYHTCASRIVKRGTMLLIATNGRRALAYCNDNFGEVRKGNRVLKEPEVRRLVDAGVLSAADLATVVARDLGVLAIGQPRADIWEVIP